MRQTIAFQATGFDCSPVQVEIDENGEPPDPESLPVALLAFESGPNVVLTLPLATSDAENMMNAFTQAEPYRQEIPDAGNWEPQPSGLPEGLFWALQPTRRGRVGHPAAADAPTGWCPTGRSPSTTRTAARCRSRSATRCASRSSARWPAWPTASWRASAGKLRNTRRYLVFSALSTRARRAVE